MNGETLPPTNDLIISPEERQGMTRVLEDYIDSDICAPDIDVHRSLANDAQSFSRRIYQRNFNHREFLERLNGIALDESQPTFARLTVLRSITEYRGRFEEKHEAELETIVRNLVTLTNQWAETEFRRTGFLDDAVNQDINRRQLLLYAASYNALRQVTPVDNRNERERQNSKWLRVASDVLQTKRLVLHLPSRDTTTITNDEESIRRASSGYPYVSVLCPPNYVAEWIKFEEACAYGIPEKKKVFKPRLPAALVGVETQRLETEPTSDQIMRHSKVYSLRIPALPSLPAVQREMEQEERIVSESELVRSHMITNMSYVIAMRSIKEVLRRRSELGFGEDVPTRLVLDYVQRNVQRLTQQVTHPRYVRRVELGLDVQEHSILGLAILQHRDETSYVWTDRELLSQYLIRAASSLAIARDERSGTLSTRSFDQIHKLVVHRAVIGYSLDVLAEFADYFLRDGERSFLNDTELAYVEDHEQEIHHVLRMYRLMKLEEENSVSASSEFPTEEWKRDLRRFLHQCMRVRFETIRDISIEDVDRINWDEQ
ncbi:hypothetical protein HY469_05990 [Candidatus Roizmanbacteria bacterium]|nr:hypothetical protein [Candidatus Roizmanbacteria bacterium]